MTRSAEEPPKRKKTRTSAGARSRPGARRDTGDAAAKAIRGEAVNAASVRKKRSKGAEGLPEESPTPTQVEAAPGERRRLKSDPGNAAGREFAIEAARVLADDKCTDVLVLDVRGKSPVADYIVVASGTSDRQMRSAIQHLEEAAMARGQRMFRSNADDRATWLLADFFDVMAHIFEPNTRAHYDLEMLWGDAPRLTWERAAGEAEPAARRRGPRTRTVVEDGPPRRAEG